MSNIKFVCPVCVGHISNLDLSPAQCVHQIKTPTGKQEIWYCPWCADYYRVIYELREIQKLLPKPLRIYKQGEEK